MQTKTNLKEPKKISLLREVIKGNIKKIKDPKNGETLEIYPYLGSLAILVYDSVNDSQKKDFLKLSFFDMICVAYSL